jgi:hypothetical protein
LPARDVPKSGTSVAEAAGLPQPAGVGTVVRNLSDEPLSVPLDARGLRSRSLAPGDATTLPWAAMGGFRLRALVGTGAVEDSCRPT